MWSYAVAIDQMMMMMMWGLTSLDVGLTLLGTRCCDVSRMYVDFHIHMCTGVHVCINIMCVCVCVCVCFDVLYVVVVVFIFGPILPVLFILGRGRGCWFGFEFYACDIYMPVQICWGRHKPESVKILGNIKFI